MTKTLLITNLREIEGFKFACRKCGASAFVPLKENNPPERCFSCGNMLNKPKIKDAIAQFGLLVELSDANDFDVFIETEQK